MREMTDRDLALRDAEPVADLLELGDARRRSSAWRAPILPPARSVSPSSNKHRPRPSGSGNFGEVRDACFSHVRASSWCPRK